MAEMCGAGLHEMTGENQHRDHLGRKAGCKACLLLRGKRRNDAYCKNWHRRTEENTHTDEKGLRHCKQCPSWPAFEERLRRQEESGRAQRVLTERELRSLRASVPCVVCRQIPREFTVKIKQRDKQTRQMVEVSKIVVQIPHGPMCPVPHIPEGDGKRPGRPRMRPTRDQSYTGVRPDEPCAFCGKPVTQPWKKRTVMYCSTSCNTYASRARKAAQKASA